MDCSRSNLAQSYLLTQLAHTHAPHSTSTTEKPISTDERWQKLWTDWLQLGSGKRRTGSPHTTRSYREATSRWFRFLACQQVPAWHATASEVATWVQHLQQGDEQHRPLSASAINQRLAACSSFYIYVAKTPHRAGKRQRTLNEDDEGKPLPNPFQGTAVSRLPVPVNKAPKFWSIAQTDQLLADLERRCKTRTGSRNYALILGYLLTGYRSMEFVRLRWGDIRANRQQPGWVVEWQGKGNKQATDALPARVYHAIVDYLTTNGRNPALMEPEEYIFRPLLTHQVKNLKNQGTKERTTEHISTKQVESILKGALRRAGIERTGTIRVVHGLRHTFAERHYRSRKDVEALRKLLHHGDVATTGIYVRTEFSDDPVDDFSDEIYAGLRRA